MAAHKTLQGPSEVATPFALQHLPQVVATNAGLDPNDLTEGQDAPGLGRSESQGGDEEQHNTPDSEKWRGWSRPHC
jgi:hypothetical protein